MTHEDKSVEQARAEARTQEWTPERVLKELWSVDLFDYKLRERCIAMRDELVPGLRKTMGEQDGNERLKASLLLLHLGEPSGTEGIITCLRTNDNQLRSATLAALSVLPLRPLTENAPSWQKPPVPLQREAVFAELEPLLAEPESHVGGLALNVVMQLALPQAECQIMTLVRHSSRKVRTKVVKWLAARGEDRGVEVAEALLFEEGHNPDDDHWLALIVGALKTYSQGNNPELALRAANLLVRYVLASLNYSDQSTANHVWKAMTGIAAARHPEEVSVLEAVLQSSIVNWGRGIALKRLGEIEGELGIKRLQRALSDAELREYAAESISKLAKGRIDPALVDALIAALQEETRGQVLSALVDALIAVGADVVPTLVQVSERLKPYDAMRVLWLAEGITPRKAAEQLVRAGAILTPPEALLLQLEESWHAERDPAGVVFSLLSSFNRFTCFDCETTIPVNYVSLIEDLMKLGGDVFQVEAVSENNDQVQFVYRDQVYCFTVRDLGDWYDLEAVIPGLNRALADTGRQERFILLYTGGQLCSVTFASELAFQEVACELHLPIESNYQAAMSQGVAYEQYVMSQMQEKRTEADSNPTD